NKNYWEDDTKGDAVESCHQHTLPPRSGVGVSANLGCEQHLYYKSRVPGNLVLVHRSIFHDELNILEQFDIAKRVTLHRHHVGEHAGTNRTDAIGPPHQFRGVRGASLQRLRRSEAELNHRPELASVQSMRIHSS